MTPSECMYIPFISDFSLYTSKQALKEQPQKTECGLMLSCICWEGPRIRHPTSQQDDLQTRCLNKRLVKYPETSTLRGRRESVWVRSGLVALAEIYIDIPWLQMTVWCREVCIRADEIAVILFFNIFSILGTTDCATSLRQLQTAQQRSRMVESTGDPKSPRLVAEDH